MLVVGRWQCFTYETRFFLESIQERHKKWGRPQYTLSDSLPILHFFSDFSAPLKCWNPEGAVQLSHDPYRVDLAENAGDGTRPETFDHNGVMRRNFAFNHKSTIMCLSNIPLDIVLSITHLLDLQDAIHLLATCSNLASLSSSRDFWLKELDRIQTVHRRPIPCAFGTALLALPLGTLREMAIRAYALMKNWSSARPAVVWSRQYKTESSFYHPHVISGTHLIVMNSWDKLTCWDTISGTCLGGVEHPENSHAFVGWSPHELAGQCSIGVGYRIFATWVPPLDHHIY
ncbi:hypothetical protein B0H10DRAFT_864126 [Mycena sp. CBHHK59/15]|nr:hypothetical protein B0H10DRAFT_864126 [Mycena sp. CBHHK59/15]